MKIYRNGVNILEIKKVKGNTFCIDTGMTYIPFYKINEEEIIMLDSGWARGERVGIEEILEKNNFKVEAIINSHAHIDHVGNNAYLKNKYNCIIAMPAYEAFFCSSTINLKAFYNKQTLSNIDKHYGDMVCETDVKIFENQNTIKICGIEFGIFHTPGHSPAHICIITPDDVAYVGDSLISYEVMKGAKMPYAFILKEDLKSKEKLNDLKYSKYIVAHKGVYDDITKLITDNINFYKNRAQKLYDVIEGDMTMEDIMKTIMKNWKININTTYKYSKIVFMLESYVQYLEEIEAIELIMDNGFLKYRKISISEELFLA